MFKVGDRVRIKDELGFEDTYIGNIEELKEKTFTVEEIGDIRNDGSYEVIILGVNWCFRNSWLELVGDEEDKFEAFLREVVSGTSPNYINTFRDVKNLMGLSPCDDDAKKDENKLVDELVSFYKTFEPKPKPQPKKVTMSELREIIGYDFEIVEG